MNGNGNSPAYRQSVISGLAVAGFIALVGLGMWLAVYSTRFVPTVVNQIGSAAVYIGSAFIPAHKPTLTVVPVASSTIISFGQASTTPSTPVTTPVKTKPATHTTAGSQTTPTYILHDTKPIAPYGLPDLSVEITTIGYLASTSANSFVASSTVPTGSLPAVSFSIRNVGTNVSGPWRFSASAPTQNAYRQSELQQSLAPGDRVDGILALDHAIHGASQVVSITANFDNAVSETTTRNNSASTTITVLGS